jgi:hypothetical protein
MSTPNPHALLGEGPITEFITVGGVFYNGDCGQCALEVAKAAIKGLKSSQLDMVAMVHDMASHGQAGTTGASDMGEVAWEAQRQGLTILHLTTYDQPLSENWHQELLDNAGINPIILEFANAGVLTDDVTGAHDERGVQYHYIVILNKVAAGYVANDGDNSEAATTFPTYSYANLAQAVPCAIMILKGPIMSNVPEGWTDSAAGDLNVTDGVLTAPGGEKVEHGFRFYVLTNSWDAADVPTTEEFTVTGGNAQDFKNVRLFWNGASVSKEALPAAPVPPVEPAPAPAPAPEPTPAPVPTDPAIVAALSALQSDLSVLQSYLSSASTHLSQAISKVVK